MQHSARALLERLVDYAGLFPPAALDLPTTVANYADYRREDDAWMLGRLIVPAARLPEFGRLRRAVSEEEPWPLAVLLPPPERWDDLERSTATQVGQVRESLADFADCARADLFEQRLPEAPAARAEGLAACAQALEEGLEAGAEIFFEAAFAPRDDGAIREIEATVEAVAEVDARRSGSVARSGRCGFKLRCGGVRAELYPGVEVVVAALMACHRAGVVLKATAGLHHPVRHFRTDLQVYEHGFLNVFGGGVLLAAHDLDASTLTAIVAEQEASAFAFDEQGFRWRELRATTEQIIAARRERVSSFGSCSFDEPREDLRDLGHL